MHYRAWTRAGTAMLLAATPCFSAYAQNTDPLIPVSAATSGVPILNPASQAALQRAISSGQRIEPARDRWRNPAATLQFFGVRPTDTVIEIWPGQGWYTSILGPYLKQGSGSLIVGHFDASSTNSSAVRQMVDAFRARFASDTGSYGAVSVVPFGPLSGPLGLPGTADSVLTFRNIHNWMAQGWAEKAFGDFFLVLKPGGILGIEEHRGRTDEPQDPLARDGYVREDYVILLAREAGFEFIGRSEINANPTDTKDHPFGVWTLPPVSRTSRLELRDDPGFDRTRYDAIGESDRMTLRFRKPLNATGAAPVPGTRWSPVIVMPAPATPTPRPVVSAARSPLPVPVPRVIAPTASAALPATRPGATVPLNPSPSPVPAIISPSGAVPAASAQTAIAPPIAPPRATTPVQTAVTQTFPVPTVAPMPVTPVNPEAAAPRARENPPAIAIPSQPIPASVVTPQPVPAQPVPAQPLPTLPVAISERSIDSPVAALPSPSPTPPPVVGVKPPPEVVTPQTPRVNTTPQVASAPTRPTNVTPTPSVAPPARTSPVRQSSPAPVGKAAPTARSPAPTPASTPTRSQRPQRPQPTLPAAAALPKAQATPLPATRTARPNPTPAPKTKTSPPPPARPLARQPVRPVVSAPKAKAKAPPPPPANPNKPDWVVPRQRS